MLASKKTVGYGSHSYRWKYHPTPWKLFLDAVTKPRDATLSLFGNKRIVLGIVTLSVIIAGIVLAQGPLFHSMASRSSSSNDPYTMIWQPSNSSTLFQHSLGTETKYKIGPLCSANPNSCEELTSNSSTTAVSITSDPIGELSLASGKNLVFEFIYQWCCGGVQSNPQPNFGWFITTNKTIPV